MRQYQQLWLDIKAKKDLTLAFTTEARARTVTQAIKKEKARENAPRRALEIGSLGKLEISVHKAYVGQHAGKWIVRFKLIPPAEVFSSEL